MQVVGGEPGDPVHPAPVAGVEVEFVHIEQLVWRCVLVEARLIGEVG